MADHVNVILERQLPELEDLREHDIFNEAEIRAIATKRRDFEYLLKRRSPRRVDFIRYIKYEMDLDEDRKRRKAALGIRKSLKSDHSCHRHVHFIFERLLRRFPSDMDAWRQFAEYCNLTGASKALSELFGRVLRLHPHSVEFWVRAASHELYEIGSMDGARLLMQRGLRVNRGSQEMWLAYFKLELDCLAKVKDQRAVLGITPSTDAVVSVEPSVGGLPESSITALPAEADVLATSESDFLQGAIARIVHSHAVKEIRNDVEFELRFAEIAAQARDVSTKESRVARALLVPALLDDIVLRCKDRYAEEPALWEFLATHAKLAPLTTPHSVAPTTSRKKHRASSVVEEESEYAMACRVFEQGLATVPESKHSDLLRRFLAFVKPQCTGPHGEAAIEKAVDICDKLTMRTADIDVASLHCTLLAGRGDSKACVAVGERLVAALPTEPRAWLLLADVTEVASAALPAVLAVLDRGIKQCAPLLALGDAANKEKLEPLWRRRIEVQLSLSPAARVNTDFQTVTGYGMLTAEAKLWSVLSK